MSNNIYLSQIEGYLKTTESISNIYQNLIKLEINGQKETADYQTWLKHLSCALEVQETYIKRLEQSTKGKTAFLDIVSSNVSPLLDDSENIILDKNNLPLDRRLYLHSIVHTYFLEHFTYNISPYIFLAGISGLKKISKEKEDLGINKDIVFAFSNEIISNFLKRMEEEMASTCDKDLRDRLIKIKYNIAFLYPELETKLLQNRFKASEIPFIESKEICNILNIDSATSLSLKKMFITPLGLVQTKKMNINDKDYQHDKPRQTLRIRELLLESILSLLPKQEIKRIGDVFQKTICDDPKICKHSTEVITSTIKRSADIDEATKKYIYFLPRK